VSRPTRPLAHTRRGNLLLRSPRWRAYARVAELARRGRIVHDGHNWRALDGAGRFDGPCDREVGGLIGQRLPAFTRTDERLVKLLLPGADRPAYALATVLLLADHGYDCLIAACNVYGVTLAALMNDPVTA
jgi:hypothetical protein